MNAAAFIVSLDPQWIIAIATVASVGLAAITAIITAILWIIKRMINEMKSQILDDLDEKHKANQIRYDALALLVTRHDTMLNPEFNGGLTPAQVRRGH